ncbi:MAG: hypothetical protein MMC23_010106 [Stictis urceolatum]|nr:hypothetical protein [Stictis urceolata]
MEHDATFPGATRPGSLVVEGHRPLMVAGCMSDEAAQKRDKQDEDSPLLEAQKPDDEETLLGHGGSQNVLYELSEGDAEESRSLWYLFILTLSIGGLQIAWATELSNGSPFLLSLGLSKALLAFVWIAGPLTGVLVQPYIGILSDRCRISWGKRRPFMIGGAAGTIVSLIALAWTKEIVEGFLSLFGADPESQSVRTTSIVFAVIWVYVLDFAINAGKDNYHLSSRPHFQADQISQVQAAIRAFIVDNAPTHQQEDANAWAGRITGFGSILGYLSGYVNLPMVFPLFGDTQFKVLCVFSAIALGSTVVVSCVFIKERDPRLEGYVETHKLGAVSFLRQTFTSLVRLPPQIRKICEVQFFNWIGWFPFLFYITTYIGQLKVNPIFEEHPNLPVEEVDKYWEEATRVGSFALLIYAITSFVASILLPIVVVPSYRPVHPTVSSQSGTRTPWLFRFLSKFRIPHLTLRRAWLYSHLLFAACMLCTLLVTTPGGATVLTAFVGISWALTMWAPFALISAEISKRETIRRARKARYMRTPSGQHDQTFSQHRESFSGDDEGHDQAGVVLGLHNVAVSAPQILATLVSSAIFKATQKDRGAAGDDSIGWVLRFGGLAAIAAAVMTWRLDEGRAEETAD